MKKLSHFDEQGKIKMVDVSDKQTTKRRAVASGKILMNAETLEALKNQTNPKGNPFEKFWLVFATILGKNTVERYNVDLIPPEFN